MQNEAETHATLVVDVNPLGCNSWVPPSHVPPLYLKTLSLWSIAMQNVVPGHDTDSSSVVASMSWTVPNVPLSYVNAPPLSSTKTQKRVAGVHDTALSAEAPGSGSVAGSNDGPPSWTTGTGPAATHVVADGHDTALSADCPESMRCASSHAGVAASAAPLSAHSTQSAARIPRHTPMRRDIAPSAPAAQA